MHGRKLNGTKKICLFLISFVFISIAFLVFSTKFGINKVHAEKIGNNYEYYLPLLEYNQDGSGFFNTKIIIENQNANFQGNSPILTIVNLQIFSSDGTLQNITHVHTNNSPNDALPLSNCGNSSGQGNIKYPQCTIYPNGSFPNNFFGSGIITSTQPLKVVVETDVKGFNGSGYSAIVTSNNLYTMPFIYNSCYDVTTSLINIVNVGNASATMTLTYYDTNGNTGAGQNLTTTLSAHSQYYKPNFGATSLSNLLNIPIGNNTSCGWISITSSINSRLVSQVTEAHTTNPYYSFENGLAPSTQSTEYIPLISNKFFGGFVSGSDVINPTNRTVSAFFHVTYTDAAGNVNTRTIFHRIDPHHILSISDATVIPDNTYGFVKIDEGAGAGLVVGTNITNTSNNFFGSYGSVSDASTTVGIPVLLNGVSGGSGFAIQNTGPATSVTITYYDLGGNSVGSENFNIAAGQAITDFQSARNIMPANFIGTAIAVSSNPSSGIFILENIQTPDSSGNGNVFATYTEPINEYAPIHSYTVNISINSPLTFNTFVGANPNSQNVFLSCDDATFPFPVQWSLDSNISGNNTIQLTGGQAPSSGSSINGFFLCNRPPSIQVDIVSSSSPIGQYNGNIHLTSTDISTARVAIPDNSVTLNVIGINFSPNPLVFRTTDTVNSYSPSNPQNISVTCSSIVSLPYILNLITSPILPETAVWANIPNTLSGNCNSVNSISTTANKGSRTANLNPYINKLNITGSVNAGLDLNLYIDGVSTQINTLANQKFNCMKDNAIFNLLSINQSSQDFKISSFTLSFTNPPTNTVNSLSLNTTSAIYTNSNPINIPINPQLVIPQTNGQNQSTINLSFTNPIISNAVCNLVNQNLLPNASYTLSGTFGNLPYTSKSANTDFAIVYPPAWAVMKDNTAFSQSRFQNLVSRASNGSGATYHWILNKENTTPLSFTNPDSYSRMTNPNYPFTNSALFTKTAADLAGGGINLNDLNKNCANSTDNSCEGPVKHVTSLGNLIQNYYDQNVSNQSPFAYSNDNLSQSPKSLTDSQIIASTCATTGYCFDFVNNQIIIDLNNIFETDKKYVYSLNTTYDVVIKDDLTDGVNQKNGMIFFITTNGKKIFIQNPNNVVSNASSALIVTNSDVEVQSQNNNSANYTNNFNIGIATKGNIAYTCIQSNDLRFAAYNLDLQSPIYQTTNGCKTVQQGFIFALGNINLNYSNIDVVTRPTLTVTYNPNYIIDFKKIFANISSSIKYVGLDF